MLPQAAALGSFSSSPVYTDAHGVTLWSGVKTSQKRLQTLSRNPKPAP
jgi:hypothetical protein